MHSHEQFVLNHLIQVFCNFCLLFNQNENPIYTSCWMTSLSNQVSLTTNCPWFARKLMLDTLKWLLKCKTSKPNLTLTFFKVHLLRWREKIGGSTNCILHEEICMLTVMFSPSFNLYLARTWWGHHCLIYKNTHKTLKSEPLIRTKREYLSHKQNCQTVIVSVTSAEQYMEWRTLSPSLRLLTHNFLPSPV